MGALVHRLEEILSPPLESLGYGIVRILYAKVKRGRLQVMIERLDGQTISMEDCVAASREISVTMDVVDPIEESYTLEVTSPGLDRPLVKPEHFQRFAGEEVEIHLFAPQDGRRKFQGILKEADNEKCVLSVTDKEETTDFVFSYGNITRANILPQY